MADSDDTIESLKKKIIELQAEVAAASIHSQGFDIIPGSAYVVNKDNVYLICNEQQVKDVGCNSAEEIQGKSNEELWQHHAEQLNRNNEQVKKTGKPCTFEEKVDIKGVTRTYVSSKAPYYKDGELAGVFGVSIEITDRKRQENYSKNLNLGKMQAFEVIDQEIRSTTNNVIGITALMLRALDTNDFEQVKSIIREGCHDIDKSVLSNQYKSSHTVDFYRLFTGKEQPYYENEDLKAFIKGILARLDHEFANHELQVSVDYDPTVPHAVNMETAYFTVILETLLRNAIRFNHDTKISIAVQSVDAKTLKLTITDNGTNLGKHDGLFDLFTMNPEEVNAKSPGYMLSLCKFIVNYFGGDIGYDTNNQAVSFWFTVPIKAVTNAHTSVTTESATPPKTKTKKLKKNITVLLVEDDPLATQGAKDKLEAAKFTVIPAKNGEKALKILEKNHIDVVLTDINMPRMNGVVLLEEIKKKFKDKPVIAFTSHRTGINKQKYIEQGFTDVVYKPDGKRQLPALINHYAG